MIRKILFVGFMAGFAASALFGDWAPVWKFQAEIVPGISIVEAKIRFIPEDPGDPVLENDGSNRLQDFRLNMMYENTKLQISQIFPEYSPYWSGSPIPDGFVQDYQPGYDLIQGIWGQETDPEANPYYPDPEGNNNLLYTFWFNVLGDIGDPPYEGLIEWIDINDPLDNPGAVVDGTDHYEHTLFREWADEFVHGTYLGKNHLGLDEDGNDIFPVESVEASGYTGVASARQALEYLGPAYGWPTQSELYQTYHLDEGGVDGEDISPENLRSLLNALTYDSGDPDWRRIYHFGVNQDVDQETALKRLIHWMDYAVPVPDGRPYNVPAQLPLNGMWDWVTVRGFASDVPPTVDGSVWSWPDSLTVHGLWINDPREILQSEEQIGYNVYATADDLALLFLPVDGVYYSVAEPPEADDESELEANLDSVEIELAQGAVSHVLAGALAAEANLAVLRSYSELYGNIIVEEQRVNGLFGSMNWTEFIPTALLSTPGFQTGFSGARYKTSLPVLDMDTGEEYNLLLFGAGSDPNGASVVLLVDAGEGQFRQASWTGEEYTYLSRRRAEEMALQAVKEEFGIDHLTFETWKKRTRAIFSGAGDGLISSRLVYSVAFGQSAYQPVHEVVTPFGPTVYVTQDGDAEVTGELLAQFVGDAPVSSVVSGEFEGSEPDPEEIDRFRELAKAQLPIVDVVFFAAEETDQGILLREAEIWIRIEGKTEDTGGIMARASVLYRQATGTYRPVTVILWKGSERLESRSY